MNYDAIVVGAGLWGCTVSRILADSGKKVLLLEKRDKIGGNASSHFDEETGIEVHDYGSHIFHTENDDVWDFVKRFTKFNGYHHLCVSKHKGKNYFLPIGLPLINSFFNVALNPEEVNEFLDKDGNRERLFDAFIRGYTSKQWGVNPEEVDESIIKRIPIRNNYDLNYFYDYRQGIPLDGYESMFSNMVKHPLINIECSSDWFAWSKEHGNEIKGTSVYYSGAIDELFGYKYGELPWRTLRFEFETVNKQDFQGNSIVNYADTDFAWTRIHEFKHYHPENKDTMQVNKTIICKEYPGKWEKGMERFYPVKSDKSEEILSLYKEENRKNGHFIMGGRLGNYRYYDMDKTILDAMETVVSKKGEA